VGESGPAPGRTDVAAAVDDVKQLLGEGRISQAVDLLGSLLPVAAEQHGAESAVVHILRKQYAATLMDDGQYRRALPELRRLVGDRAAQAGPGDAQLLQFRQDAAHCLEQLGEPAAALAEYRAVLPYCENHRATGGEPARSFEIRNRIGQLLLALGDHVGARVQLQGLLYDTERAYGPHHPLPAELRRQLDD